jgi:hypothetical protein
MDSRCFEAIVRSFGTGATSRRDALRVLAGAALVGLLARFGADGAGAQGACLDNGQRCGGELGTCCSGFCKRKRGTNKRFCRPAPGQGTCTIEQDACVDGSTCNGDSQCRCSVTTRGQSFCGGGGTCTDCTGDAKCEKLTGRGSKCVQCPNCFGFNTLCRPPCPTQV